MRNVDPVQEFERLSTRLREDTPPPVHIVSQVMRRIRAAEVASERTLTLMALGSCVAAIMVALVGFSWLSESVDPLGSFFDIVPPIGL